MVDVNTPKKLTGSTRILAFCLTAMITVVLLGAMFPSMVWKPSTVRKQDIAQTSWQQSQEPEKKTEDRGQEEKLPEDKKDGEANDAKDIKKKKEDPEWLKKVDSAFDTYLKTPLGDALFFPLYRVPKLDEDGNPITKKGKVPKEENGKIVLGEDGKPILVDGDVKQYAKVPFVVVWLLIGGIFFTCFMGFINFRGIKHAVLLAMGKFDDPKDHGEVTHFQALTSALSGTVGLGNIAGVALAMIAGGPGATFWIILIGLLGMTTKFVECTLGQMYRDEDANGQVSGGPMQYLKKGFAESGLAPVGSFLAVFFSVLCIGASFGGGNSFQVSQALGVIRGEFPLIDDNPWIFGLIMAIGIGVVVIGGIRWIGKATSFIVPFMCAGYLLMAFYVIGKNYDKIDDAIYAIFAGAFNAKAMYGGFLGVLVVGIQRAVFSNEAGAGSAAIAHSAAKTNIPVREGYVALLEPFIDTVVVCTITAIMITVSGVLENPTDKGLVEAISGNNGASVTMYAVQTADMVIFKYFLLVAVALFAYSTCISWFYYGDRCFTNLFGTGSSIIYKVLFLSFAFLGSIVTAKNILEFSDTLILGMSIPNLVGLYFLSGKVKGALTQYEEEFAAGKHQ